MGFGCMVRDIRGMVRGVGSMSGLRRACQACRAQNQGFSVHARGVRPMSGVHGVCEGCTSGAWVAQAECAKRGQMNALDIETVRRPCHGRLSAIRSATWALWWLLCYHPRLCAAVLNVTSILGLTSGPLV